MNKNIVRKHSDIIEACYALTPSELRLVYSCIAKISFDEAMDQLPEGASIGDNNCFSVNAIEYAKTFGLDIDNARRDMKKAVDRLFRQDIIIKNGSNDGTDLRIHWVDQHSMPIKGHRFKNDTVLLDFSPTVIPYLTNLKKQGNFTQYALGNISDLKSSYSIRLFEMLKKLQKISPQMIQLTELRDRFRLGLKYKRIKDFKVYVLDKAVKEINEKTDINVSYENVKHGRSITGFMFTIKKSSKTSSNKGHKKFLTEAQIITKAQKMGSLSWPQVYDALEKQGFTFERRHKY